MTFVFKANKKKYFENTGKLLMNSQQQQNGIVRPCMMMTNMKRHKPKLFPRNMRTFLKISQSIAKQLFHLRNFTSRIHSSRWASGHLPIE